MTSKYGEPYEKELEDVGVITTAFNTNKDFIIEWFRNVIATGAFGKQEPGDVSSEDPLHRSMAGFETSNIC